MSFQLRHDSEFDRSGTLYEDGWRRSMDDDSQWSWRLELEWDLSRLIFNPVELTLARLKADLRRRADNAVDLATRLYFERFSIVAEAPLATAKQCVSLRKRFLLLDSRLKALTQTERPNTRKLEPGSNGPYTVDNEH